MYYTLYIHVKIFKGFKFWAFHSQLTINIIFNLECYWQDFGLHQLESRRLYLTLARDDGMYVLTLLATTTKVPSLYSGLHLIEANYTSYSILSGNNDTYILGGNLDTYKTRDNKEHHKAYIYIFIEHRQR